MTDRATTSPLPQRAVCKSVCWILGIAAGAYLTFVLVNDFAQTKLLAGIFGIVAALLAGLVLRRVFCRQRGSRVQNRVEEALKRAATKEASFTKVSTGRVPDHSVPTPTPTPTPIITPSPVVAVETQKTDETPLPIVEVPAAPSEDQSTESQGEAPLVLDETSAVAPVSAQIKGAPPRPLVTPNNGQADELRKIDGIGEAEEKALHAAGIFHFSQFIQMNKRHLVWVDENIASEGQDHPSVSWRQQAIALSRQAKKVTEEGRAL